MLDIREGKRNGKTSGDYIDMMDAEVVTLSFKVDECTIGSISKEVKWYCELRNDER